MKNLAILISLLFILGASDSQARSCSSNRSSQQGGQMMNMMQHDSGAHAGSGGNTHQGSMTESMENPADMQTESMASQEMHEHDTEHATEDTESSQDFFDFNENQNPSPHTQSPVNP